MDRRSTAITDFVLANGKALAAYIRQKIIAADAKPYLDRLGKEGIAALDAEAAGVLLDLACTLMRRLHPEHEFLAEDLLAQLPENQRQNIHLPRSEAYERLQAHLGGERS
jgi:hypothetical protein